MQRERIPVTKEGLQALHEEYDDLVNRRRPEIIKTVAAAREEGDLSENAGYHAAKNDQGFIEGRIREIEEIFRRADIINENGSNTAGAAKLGSTVTVLIDGAEETYTIVGEIEARPSAGRISNASPFGRSLLGHRAGDEVSIQTPATMIKAKVVKVEG